jgi:excisionase family DNA binding protein
MSRVRPVAASTPAAQQETEASDVMTADDVAAYLGVDRNTVYDYAARGVIPHKRLGKRMLFRRGSIVAWFAEVATSSLCCRNRCATRSTAI